MKSVGFVYTGLFGMGRLLTVKRLILPSILHLVHCIWLYAHMFFFFGLKSEGYNHMTVSLLNVITISFYCLTISLLYFRLKVVLYYSVYFLYYLALFLLFLLLLSGSLSISLRNIRLFHSL